MVYVHDKCIHTFVKTDSQTFWAKKASKPLQVTIWHYINLWTAETVLNTSQNGCSSCQWVIESQNQTGCTLMSCVELLINWHKLNIEAECQKKEETEQCWDPDTKERTVQCHRHTPDTASMCHHTALPPFYSSVFPSPMTSAPQLLNPFISAWHLKQEQFHWG